MHTIWKYEILSWDFVISAGSLQILSVGLDPKGVLCIWGMVNTEAPTSRTHIRVFGTGAEVPLYTSLEFLGTVTAGLYVWHVFKEN